MQLTVATALVSVRKHAIGFLYCDFWCVENQHHFQEPLTTLKKYLGVCV
jgi:hypothetical protein